ncbi:hypothetical protein EC991_010723 [Linnemannia zychae]|nr:hypothetical protein EC991_010723 [Linnemannia zychae]
MDHSMASGFKPGLGSAVWSPDLTPMSEPQYVGALIGLFLLSIGFRALVAAQGYLEAYLHLHYYPRPASSHSLHSSRGSQSSYLQQQNPLLNSGGQVAEEDGDEDGEEGAHHHQKQQQHIDDATRIGLPTGEKNDPSLHQQGLSGQGLQQHQQTSGKTPTRRRYGTNNRHNSNLPPFYAHNTPASSPLPFLTFPTAQPFIWQAEVSRAVLTTAVIGIGYMLMLVIMTYNSAYLGVILAGVFVGEVYFARWGRVRPVFPSTSAVQAVGRASRLVETKQQQQSSDGTAQGGAVARTAAMSTTSLASSTSSHGYSTAMAHHGLSGDGSC